MSNIKPDPDYEAWLREQTKREKGTYDVMMLERVSDLVLKRMKNQEIANELNCHVSTVKRYVRHLLDESKCADKREYEEKEAKRRGWR